MKPDKISVKIGEKIRKARKEKKLTQQELAEKVGITQKTLSFYEIGRNDVPAIIIKKLAEILEKDINYFFYDEDEIPGGMDDMQKEIYNTIKELSNGEKEKILNIIKIIKGLNRAEDNGVEVKKAMLDKLYQKLRIPKNEAVLLNDLIFKILTMDIEKRKAFLKLIN